MVSIVVPVYNSEQYLRECLDSLLNQTYRDIEVVLVDDGSTDGSPSICDEYARENSGVRVFHNANSGANASRKFGVEKATGEYVFFVDADDIIALDTVETAMALAGDGIDLVSMEEREDTVCTAGGYAQRLLHWQAVHVWGKLFKREVLLSDWTFDIPRDITIAEDLLMNLRAVRNISGKVVISSAHKYSYRIVNGSLAHSSRITPAYDWKVLQHVTKIVEATPLDLRHAFVDFRISILRHLICGRYKFDRQWAAELKKDSEDWQLDRMQTRVIKAIDRPMLRPVIRAVVIANKIKGKLAKI